VNKLVMCQGLGSLASSDSELTHETVNLLKQPARPPWMGDRPIARPLPTQESTTQKNADIHSRIELDWNPRPQCSGGPRLYVP